MPATATAPHKRKPSANQMAERYMTEMIAQGKSQVFNTDLQDYIADRLKMSKQVLNGTLDGTGANTLAESSWYTDVWQKEKLDNGRIVHVLKGSRSKPQREYDFEYPMKRSAAKKIMEYLPETGSPRLLTLASISGNCVQAAIARNPRTQIDNVECAEGVLKDWRKRKAELGVQTTDYNCRIQEFVVAPGFADAQYDLINADVMGYAGRSMYAYLQPINEAQNASFIALTTQCLNAFRNAGPFQDALRAKYKNHPDAHAACIADWLFNYEMLERLKYQKDKGCRFMEVFIFRKGHE